MRLSDNGFDVITFLSQREVEKYILGDMRHIAEIRMKKVEAIIDYMHSYWQRYEAQCQQNEICSLPLELAN